MLLKAYGWFSLVMPHIHGSTMAVLATVVLTVVVTVLRVSILFIEGPKIISDCI